MGCSFMPARLNAQAQRKGLHHKDTKDTTGCSWAALRALCVFVVVCVAKYPPHPTLWQAKRMAAWYNTIGTV
jgi:hypothetical protein